MQPVLAGALAGTLATLFHTAVMYALRARLPTERGRPLPPTEVTRAALQTTGVAVGTPLRGATALAHFGFGAGVGALYGALTGRAKQRFALGVGYGVGVWALSYLGWIPALRLLRPATREPPARNLMMILAHAAWGAALVGLIKRLSSTER